MKIVWGFFVIVPRLAPEKMYLVVTMTSLGVNLVSKWVVSGEGILA